MGSATSTAASTISASLKELMISITEFLEVFTSGSGDYDRNRQKFVRKYNDSREVLRKYIRDTPDDLDIRLLTDVQLVLSGDIARIMQIQENPDEHIINSLSDYVTELSEYIQRFGEIASNHGFWNSLKRLFKSIASGIGTAIAFTSRLAIRN